MATRELCRQGDPTRKHIVVLKDERDGNHAYMTDKDEVKIQLKEKELREKGETDEEVIKVIDPMKKQLEKEKKAAYEAFIKRRPGQPLRTPQEIEAWEKSREIPLPYELCDDNTPDGYLAFDQITLFPGIAQKGSQSTFCNGRSIVCIGTVATDIVQERYKIYKVVETKEATLPNPEYERQKKKIAEERKKAETEKRKKEAEWRKQQSQAKSAASQRGGSSKSKTPSQPAQPAEQPKMPEFPGYQGPTEPDVEKTVTVNKKTVKDRQERYVEIVYTEVTTKEGSDSVFVEGIPATGTNRMIHCYVKTEDGAQQEYMAEAEAPYDKGSKNVYVN